MHIYRVKFCTCTDIALNVHAKNAVGVPSGPFLRLRAGHIIIRDKTRDNLDHTPAVGSTR